MSHCHWQSGISALLYNHFRWNHRHAAADRAKLLVCIVVSRFVTITTVELIVSSTYCPWQMPTVVDSHWQSLTVTDSQWQSLTVTDSHRQSPTVTDSHRFRQWLVVLSNKSVYQHTIKVYVIHMYVYVTQFFFYFR